MTELFLWISFLPRNTSTTYTTLSNSSFVKNNDQQKWHFRVFMWVCMNTSKYCWLCYKIWPLSTYIIFSRSKLPATHWSTGSLISFGYNCIYFSRSSFEATVIRKAHYWPLLLHCWSDFHFSPASQTSPNQSPLYLPTELIWSGEFGPFMMVKRS